MISFLQGKLVEALPTQVVVDVAGVGYEVLIPLSSYNKLPGPGQPVKLLTQLVVREDAHVLYGFMSVAERDLFRLLVQSVSGIGPKTALNILSGMPVADFRAVVSQGDVRALGGITGVGRKTAERIVVELRDKMSVVEGGSNVSGRPGTTGGDQRMQDATLALMALGFRPAAAQETVRAAEAMLGKEASVEELVRASLKKG